MSDGTSLNCKLCGRDACEHPAWVVRGEAHPSFAKSATLYEAALKDVVRPGRAECDVDLADAKKDIPIEAFDGRGAEISHVRRKIWAAQHIIELCWRWLGGELDNEQRKHLILAMESFLDMLRRPSTTARD